MDVPSSFESECVALSLSESTTMGFKGSGGEPRTKIGHSVRSAVEPGGRTNGEFSTMGIAEESPRKLRASERLERKANSRSAARRKAIAWGHEGSVAGRK